MQELVAACTRAETLHNQNLLLCTHLYNYYYNYASCTVCLAKKDMDLYHSQNDALGVFTVASRAQPTWSSVAGNTWHTSSHSP